MEESVSEGKLAKCSVPNLCLKGFLKKNDLQSKNDSEELRKIPFIEKPIDVLLTFLGTLRTGR